MFQGRRHIARLSRRALGVVGIHALTVLLDSLLTGMLDELVGHLPAAVCIPFYFGLLLILMGFVHSPDISSADIKPLTDSGRSPDKWVAVWLNGTRAFVPAGTEVDDDGGPATGAHPVDR